MGKRLLAALCTAMLLMTTPGVAVLADESISDETVAVQVEETTDTSESEEVIADVSVTEENTLNESEQEEVINETSISEEGVEEIEDTSDAEEIQAHDISVVEETSVLDEDSTEIIDEVVGEGDAQTFIVGDGVKADYNETSGTVIFYSNGGTLSKNWKSIISQSFDNFCTIKASDTSGTIMMPEDSSGMFQGLSSLSSIDLRKFDTSKVTNMSEMFCACKKLKSLDLSSFNTSNVTDMSYMFGTHDHKTAIGNDSLINLNVSSFNTSNVVNMEGMFNGCINLKNLNVSSFDTSNVENMSFMFGGCRSLNSIDLSCFNTSKVNNMSCMFYVCTSLSSLNISKFDTSNVTDMSHMFRLCSSLSSLDLSSFDISKVQLFYAMFSESYNIQLLKTPKKNTVEGIGLHLTMYDNDGNQYDELPCMTGSLTLTLKGKDISKCTMDISPTSFVYNFPHEIQVPSATIKDGNYTLIQNTDYIIKYKDYSQVGTGTITAIGTGKKYIGSISRTFTITPAEPELEFESTTVSKNLFDDEFVNSLIKFTDGSISYKSSNTAVAAVNSTSGLVKIKGVGTTTITATATAGKNYKAGSASYTLNVTDNSVQYTIIYNANGGTGTPSSQTKRENVSLTLSSVKPTKKYLIRYNANGGSVSPSSKNVSCIFKNWNTSKNGSGTSYASGSSYTTNADATLYAQWKNPTAGELATPTRSGFTFVGWFTSATGGNEVKSSSTVNGDITLYAHWTDPYNLGDETYSFANYSDSDSWGGHCFGMSMTSSGYKNNKLDIRRIGGTANTPLYSFNLTSIVKEPICYYQGKQGYIREKATVAGGSKYLTGKNNIASDWSAVVNYVKNHKYDYTGLLQIGFRKEGQGGHAINFLYYKNVNGQDRIYAYDNNFPKQETYFYQDSYGRVYEAPVQTFNGAIDCIALRDIRIYFDDSSDFDSTHVVYMEEEAASIQGYDYSYMEGSDYVMYEIPADQKKVTIIPKKDNADFIYADTEYSFGKITDETRGELTFSSMDVETGGSDAKFVIYNKKPVAPTVTLSKTSYTYDGDMHRPNVTVKVDGNVLKASQDYTVEYPAGMINVGVYKVKVTLKGKYEGILYASFEIKKGGANDLGNASVGGVSLSYGYSGKSYTPAVTVKLGGVTLTKETDYTVKYENNVNPGTAKITVTGKGKYTGRRIKTFEIVDCVSSVVSGKTYLLIPKNNAKTAVCAVGGKMVNNTKVYITDRGNSESQKFKAVKNSDGTWKFINAKCELALAVQQNSSALGAGLVLYDQTTKPAQNWKLSKKSDNSFAIINSVTGYSIAMSDKSAAKGTTLSMAETASVGLQRFYIVETSAVSAPFDGTKSIRAAKDKNFAVNIASASKEDGANVSLYTYTNSNARKFKIIYSGGGYYRLVNVNSGLCLTIKDNSDADGANVIQSKWKGYSSQRWKITKNSDGTVTITNMLGTVLHLLGNRTTNNTNIHARKAASTTAQKWYLH